MYTEPFLNIFGKDIYLYGIFIAIGLIACLFVFYFYTKKAKMSPKVQDFIFYVAVIAIALGFVAAKLFQAFYDWIDGGFKQFDFYGAGITAMGGFIGGAGAFLAAYFGIGPLIFKGKEKNLHVKDFNKVFLVAPICITTAQAFGRIGCLMAGCCYGRYLGQTYVFGGIWMNCKGVAGYYVPTQLYEALFLFALTAVLSILYFKRCNFIMQLYLICYGAFRIIIEIFRDDYRGAIVLGLAPSQWLSILFIVGGIALFLVYYFKKIPFFLKEEVTEVNSDDNDNTQDDLPTDVNE